MSRTQEPTTESTGELQVLEFSLGSETYAIAIEYIEEIAHVGELTPIPNSPSHITGVMDLRGRTTAVVDPRMLFEVEGDGEADRVLVFDPDQFPDGQAIGWTVDDVHQVVTVRSGDAEEAPGADTDAIKGVFRRDDEFVIWVDPEGVEA